jgi:hypothetical protein
MAERLKQRFSSLVDSLIFAGKCAGGVIVWTALKSLPFPAIWYCHYYLFINFCNHKNHSVVFTKKNKTKTQKAKVSISLLYDIIPILEQMHNRNMELSK